MPSVIDLAKRALVALLMVQAASRGVVLNLQQGTPVAEIRSAYRKVSRETHSDCGDRGRRALWAMIRTGRACVNRQCAR